jgi:penicillin-binding protein 2
LAVVVENAGFGSEAAAPIARRVFDYWIAKLWPSNEDMAATQIGKSTGPIGKQRDAKDVLLPGLQGGGFAQAVTSAPGPVVLNAKP